MTDYIPHSRIVEIYARLDTNNNPYIRIVTNIETKTNVNTINLDEYNSRSFITTNANGISGKFEKV